MFSAVTSNYVVEYKTSYETKSIYELQDNTTNKNYRIIWDPKTSFLYHNSIRNEHNINEENSTIMQEQNYYTEIKELYDEENNQLITLNQPLILRIEVDKNGFYYINEKYNLYIYGITQDEAEKNIVKELKSQYIIYALEKDDNLDKNAKKLKYDLLSLMGENNAKKS